MSMLHRAAEHFVRWTQIALLLSSALMILVPSLRMGITRPIFWALFNISCAVGVYHAWKAGYMTKTPRQVFESAARRPALTPLDKASFLIALVAALILVTTT